MRKDNIVKTHKPNLSNAEDGWIKKREGAWL